MSTYRQRPDGVSVDHPKGESSNQQAPFTVAPKALHVCFNCASELVYPLDWCEEGVHHWRIVLRCPECESRREGTFEVSAVEALDDELGRAAGALLGDTRRMEHANMSEEADFFIRALDAGLITPDDF